jgi:magnesium chelatase family protein
LGFYSQSKKGYYMMKRALSAALWGLDAFDVGIEVDCSLGLPGFSMVGLPDSAVRESRERVVAALRNNGFQILNRKLTISLTPADRKKEGSSFDLAIAIGLLFASEQIKGTQIQTTCIVGELGLDGSVLPIKGAIAIGMHVLNRPNISLIVPQQNASELSALGIKNIFACSHIKECIAIVEQKGNWQQYRIQEQPYCKNNIHCSLDFADVHGMEVVRRVMEIAAAGGHHFLLSGTPGSGKSMCAKRLPGILPELHKQESLEITRIYSAAGLHVPGMPLMQERPFRAPHHTASVQSLVGGGLYPKPGELSLAHRGVLFLDELPEFSRGTLESLRQPLEDRSILISRAHYSIRFPANVVLGAAMNPCPCGFSGDPNRPCTCLDTEITRYQNRISGPLLDRIDLQVEVPPVDLSQMQPSHKPEGSASILQRVMQARDLQIARNQKQDKHTFCNGQIADKHLDSVLQMQPSAHKLLLNISKKLGLSARAFRRMQKVARTIADLDHKPAIQEDHIFEASQYQWRVYKGLR